MAATRAGKHQLLLLDWQPPLQVKYGAEGGQGLANGGPREMGCNQIGWALGTLGTMNGWNQKKSYKIHLIFVNDFLLAIWICLLLYEVVPVENWNIPHCCSRCCLKFYPWTHFDLSWSGNKNPPRKRFMKKVRNHEREKVKEKKRSSHFVRPFMSLSITLIPWFVECFVQDSAKILVPYLPCLTPLVVSQSHVTRRQA